MVDYGFAIPPGKEIFIGVSPEGITADNDIKAIPMEKRGCYATGERRLKFYHHYSLLNCYMECVSNYTDKVNTLQSGAVYLSQGFADHVLGSSPGRMADTVGTYCQAGPHNSDKKE